MDGNATDGATETSVPDILTDRPDPINPPHYRGDRVMRIIEQYGLGFCLGNVVKYVLRHEAKAGIEDLRKARWYLDRKIRFGMPRDPDPRSAHPDREDDVVAIVAEFGLGFCLGSAIAGILRRGEGTQDEDLKAALRFLDRKIFVVSEGVLPPPGPMLGLDIATHGAAHGAAHAPATSKVETSAGSRGYRRDGCGNLINPVGQYYVQDARPGSCVGNCASWWRSAGEGYTCDLSQAGAYYGSDLRGTRDTDVPWPVGHVCENSVVHVRADSRALLRRGSSDA